MREREALGKLDDVLADQPIERMPEPLGIEVVLADGTVRAGPEGLIREPDDGAAES